MEELFQHLRGRLDEIALHEEAALADEGVLAADQVMHEMTELVQEHHNVTVLHQARVPGRAAREVAHQRTLGELAAVDTEYERLGGEPLVLAFARMHVQVDAAESDLTVEDVVGGDRRMPAVHSGHRFDVDVKQRRGGGDHAALDLSVGEVGPYALRVEAELGTPILLLPVARIGS